MATNCTLFSVTESEMGAYRASSAEDDLPDYHSAGSKISSAIHKHMLQLGAEWAALHAALSKYTDDGLVAFMGSGGERVVGLDDGPRSAGRFFAPDEAAAILAALEDISDRDLPAAVHGTIARVHTFLAEVVDDERGFIVHHFA